MINNENLTYGAEPRTQTPGSGFWVLVGSGFRGTQNPEPRTRAEPRTQNPEPGFWVLGSGFCPGSGFWVLGSAEPRTHQNPEPRTRGLGSGFRSISEIFIVYHGFSLFFIDFHRFSLIFIFFHRFPWVFMFFYNFPMVKSHLTCILLYFQEHATEGSLFF